LTTTISTVVTDVDVAIRCQGAALKKLTEYLTDVEEQNLILLSAT
jgi:uncharacterized coiled-coil protein SlyX